MNSLFVRQILWHTFVAALLGPFLVCLLFVASQIAESSWLDDPATVFLSAGVMMVFGAPIIFVFVVVTFPLLFQVVRIRAPRSRTIAFSAAGSSLGFLVGVWMVHSDLNKPTSWVLVAGVVLIGLICGYLDSLAWRKGNVHEKNT